MAFPENTVNDTGIKHIWDKVVAALSGKVDKVSGKGLSTNDYTTAEKDKLAGIESGAQVNAVTSVAGKTGAVTLDKADVGLGNVDNTSDANKPISTATQNALDDKADANDVKSTQTLTGNPITITDAAGINAEALKVQFIPKQDLHGYDFPWVGGAGKNKLPLDLDTIKSSNTDGTWSGNVYSINNGTFTILTDDGGNVTGIVVNGAFNGNVDFSLFTPNTVIIPTDNYILNGCPSDGGDDSYYIEVKANGDWNNHDTGSGLVLNSSEIKGASVSVRSGASMNNKVFYPMLRLSTETDSTFATYSNICPITGYTQTSVETLTDIQSYYDIQTIVRSGKAQEVFNIGDEIPVKYTATNGTQYDMPFRVVAFQNVELQDGTTKQGMFLQSKYATLEGVQFDAPEPDNTLGSGGAKDDNVASYGYNRWSESGIRAWLNSDATANNWWGSTFERGGQTVTRRSADVAPTQLASVNGFLRGLPSSFVDVLGKVKMQTSCNTVTDSGVTDTTYDKIFLASLEQMYTTPQVSGVEGEYFEYWKEVLGLDSPSSWHPSTYEAYKTYALENHNSAQFVRLRSASRGHSCDAWIVYSGGGISSVHYGHSAGTALRSAPVCVIC